MTHATYHKWTVEEEQDLVKLVKQHGQQWRIIRKSRFQTRSIGQVKSKYYMLLKYKPQMVDPDYTPDPQIELEKELMKKIGQILRAKK
uniref:Myb-like DNA-binding domain-containing protein n=1 Tax=Trepomonas sp. PC1 TaxID=1076344 RepID=A0A146K5Z9_9EUKA|eukprot:JAP90929.1 Myb-like DNA-binding domain-containing protein [Trepomonas sp. PC1]